MTDAIHNFHPQYSSYTQYSSGELNLHVYLVLMFAHKLKRLLNYTENLCAR